MDCKLKRKNPIRLKTILQKSVAFCLVTTVMLSSLSRGITLKKAYAAETAEKTDVIFDVDNSVNNVSIEKTKKHNTSDENVIDCAHSSFSSGWSDDTPSKPSMCGHASWKGAFCRAWAKVNIPAGSKIKRIDIIAKAKVDGDELKSSSSFTIRLVDDLSKYKSADTVGYVTGGTTTAEVKVPRDNTYNTYTMTVPDHTATTYYLCFAVNHGTEIDDYSINAYVKKISVVYDAPVTPENASITVNSPSVDYGGSAPLTATGTIPNGVKWSTGATTTSIVLNNITANATYTCTAYGKDGGSNSVKQATVTVNNPSFTTNLITQKTIDPNSSTDLSVVPKSYSKVEWFKKNGATWTKVGSGLSYRVTDSAGNQNNAQYKAVAYGANANAESNICTIKISPASITNTNYPVNQTILEDQSATFECKVKNAKTIQWQKRTYGGTWTNIAGATSATLILNDCKVEDSGYYYRAYITGYAGSDIATRDGVLLTVNRRTPSLSITNQAVLESETATFVATTDSYAKEIKWYCRKDGESSYTELTNSTGAVVADKPYFEGCDTNILKIRNATLEYDNSTIKCIVTNVDKSNEKTANFTVVSKQIDSMHVEYPNDDIAFGEELDLKDVYVIVRYNNRDASLGKNFDGLTFEDGSTRKLMNVLGDHNYNVKITFGGQNYTAPLKITVADKTAPVISSVIATWKDSGETVSSNNITNDSLQKIILSAEATDDCKAESNLEYVWKIGNTQIGTGKTTEINTNGTYTVFVSDGVNISHKDIEIRAYDSLKPTITDVKITPNDEYSTYRIATVIATDDTMLAEMPYSKDNVHWQKSNAFYFGKDTTVKMYVKDCVGNVVSQEVAITNIDNDDPVIDKTERIEDDGVVYLQVYAHDDTSNIMYGYKKDSGIEWNETGKFIIEKDAERDAAGRTFYVRDEADNMVSTVISISSKPFEQDVIKDLLDASLTKNTSEWVNAETGVEISCNLSDSKMEQYMLYPSYTWNDDAIGEVTEKTVTVHKNGSYAVTMYQKDSSNNKISYKSIISDSISVNNIDAIKPVCNKEDDITNDNGIISGTAKDKQSGIAKISVKGGSKAFKDGKVIVDNTEDYLHTQRFDFTVYESGDYLITIMDRVGNTTEFIYPVEIDTRVPLNPEQVGNDLHMISW